jgi:ubiquinone/menaquinone biosynthesis C-methylase UbiE
MTDHHATVANHHAGHPAFEGLSGALVGVSLAIGGGSTARLAVELAGVAAGDRVVDVGCGPGNAVRQAARLGAEAVGVDPAPVMLRLARLLPVRGRAQWLDGSAEALPLEDQWGSVWWSLATIHHWADIDRGLHEAYRVLAPHGRLLGAERRVEPGRTGHASHGWTDEQAAVFADACRAHGFDDVTVSTHAAGHHNLLVVQGRRP